MKSRWTFRCYPTPEQEQHLALTFGCVRFVWNWALRARTDAFRAGERIGYPATDKALTALKATPDHAPALVSAGKGREACHEWRAVIFERPNAQSHRTSRASGEGPVD